MNKFIFAFILGFLLTFIVASNASFAQTTTPNRTASPAGQRPVIKTLLEGGKLQACRARYTMVLNRSKTLAKRGLTILEKFDSINSRIQQYYLYKLVPQGVTIRNYDALVADINTKRAGIRQLVDKAASDASAFSCDSTDPAGQLSVYREDMQGVIKALQEYKKSVRALLAAVIAARATISATPTASQSGGI